MLVLGFLEGRTFGNAGRPGSGQHPARGPRPCRRLHAAPRFVSDFDMFGSSRAATARPGRERASAARRLRRPAPRPSRPARAGARRHRRGAPCPCNNDLLAANFIDDGERVWLIDYEYSGNNDPCFELGNTAGECDLSADAARRAGRRRTTARRLRGQARPGPAARRWCRQYGWTLWGVIQDAHQPARLRLLGLGDGALRGGRGRASPARASRGCSTEVQADG